MTLVDTSVWVDHLRKGNTELQSLLRLNEVLLHPFVIGELACGTLKNRSQILKLLQDLPAARLAEHTEVLAFMETRDLWGRGVGWVDVHLLASALLSHGQFWTLDKRLQVLAAELKLQD
jgi:predicted nucleic acid-binding protein